MVRFLDANDEETGTAELVHGRAVLSSSVRWVERCYIHLPNDPRPLHPSDGQAFLEALPFCFTSPYFHAVVGS